MRKHILFSISFLSILVLFTTQALAGGPGFDKDVNNWDGNDGDYYGNMYDDDGWHDDDCNNEIPLDGGLSFLALAGAGLGIKKVKDNMSKNKKEK